MSPQEPYDAEGASSPPPYPYGASPQYSAYPTAPPTDDKAVWALVSAIAGFFLCPLVLHIVGWVLANQSLATIQASGGTLGGEGLAKAARILSIIGLVLYGVAILLAVLFFVGIFALSTTTEVGTVGLLTA